MRTRRKTAKEEPDPLGEFLRWRATTPHVQTTATIEAKLVRALEEILLRDSGEWAEPLRRHFPWIPDAQIFAFRRRAVEADNRDVLRLFNQYFPPRPSMAEWVTDVLGAPAVPFFQEFKRKGVSDAGLDELLTHVRGLVVRAKERQAPVVAARQSQKALRAIHTWLCDGDRLLWPGLIVSMGKPLPAGHPCALPEFTGPTYIVAEELQGDPLHPPPTFPRLQTLQLQMLSAVTRALRQYKRNLPRGPKRGAAPKGIESEHETRVILRLLKAHVAEWSDGSEKRSQEKALRKSIKEMLAAVEVTRRRRSKRQVGVSRT
jgi:hypothetical protein